MHKSAPFLLLSALALAPAPASAESVGTGCLSKTSGEIYALAAYRSSPAKNCRSGDQPIRVQLHQTGTKIAKRSGVVDLDGPQVWLEPSVLVLGATRGDNGTCELVAAETEADYAHVIMSVKPGKFQDRIRRVTVIDVADGKDEETYETDRLVPLVLDAGAMLFHDVLVDNRRSECFVSFVVEYATSLAAFYNK